MQRKVYFGFSFLLLFCLSACNLFRASQNKNPNNIVEFQILQINDVYEIAALEEEKIGGLARVATLKKQLLAQNPNTLLVLAGDFLSPSVLGAQKYNNERIAGQQMVETLNAAGLDYAIFGNHEFDISENALQKRLNESKFTWISTNTFHKFKNGTTRPFHLYTKTDSIPILSTKTLTFQNKKGAKINVELLGITLDMSQSDYVKTEKWGNLPHPKTQDICVALTHQNREDDIKLLKNQPNINLIIGGHEHEHSIDEISANRYVCKADANAKTAYLHKFAYNIKAQTYTLNSTLIPINSSLKEDETTQATVEKWLKIQADVFKKENIQPNEILLKLNVPLDARESQIRTRPMPISDMVAQSFSFAAPLSEAALFNTGSIRLDDYLKEKITQYDVLRLLPFGGRVVEAEMKGSLLNQILTTAKDKNVGSGGYLQYDKIVFEEGKFWINQEVIQPETYYRIVLPEFLLSGREKNLAFLTTQHPDIRKIHEPDPQDKKQNAQTTLIQFLKSGKWKE